MSKNEIIEEIIKLLKKIDSPITLRLIYRTISNLK